MLPGLSGRLFLIGPPALSHGGKDGPVELLQVHIHGSEKAGGRAVRHLQHGEGDVLRPHGIEVGKGGFVFRILQKLLGLGSEAVSFHQGYIGLGRHQLIDEL